MIDLIHLTFDVSHKPFGNLRLVEHEGSAITTAKRFTRKVQLYPNAAQIDVTSMNNGERIAIRCCPLKPLQGHNIFGTDNVIGLGYKLICYVLSALHIEASSISMKSWKRGGFIVEELHITYRFAVASHRFIGRVLEHILRNASLKLRAAPIEKGIGIRMRNATTGGVWLMYDKRREFDDKRKREGRYLQALVGEESGTVSGLLRHEASGNIRTELKLDKRYLKTHDLDKGTAWNTDAVKAIYLKELQLLRLGAVPSLAHATQLLDRLGDKKLRLTFLAWLKGEELTAYHERQTLKSRRDAILDAVGIDIQLDRMPTTEPPVSIGDIFNIGNMLPNFPEWTTKHPKVAYKGQSLRTKQSASVLMNTI